MVATMYRLFFFINRKSQLVIDAQCHRKVMTPASPRTVASVRSTQACEQVLPGSSGSAVWHAP